MHSAAEELSTGSRLTTVMKPNPVRGEGGRAKERRLEKALRGRNDRIMALEKVNINNKCV